MRLVAVRGRSWEWPTETNPRPRQNSGDLDFALLADPQLGFFPKSSTDYREELKRLNTASAKLESISPLFVIILGDLVQALPDDEETKGERAAQTRTIYDALRSFPKNIPVFVACGNHDVGNAPTEESLQRYQEMWGDDYYAFDVQHVRFVVLNSNVFFDSRNVLAYAQEQMRWLELQLQGAVAEKKTPILFMHHPIFWESWDEPDDLGPLYIPALGKESVKSYFHLPRRWRDPLRELVRRYNVRYSFHGHLHDNSIVITEDPPFEQVVTSAIGFPLGKAGAGYRIVTMRKSEKNRLEHRFVQLFPNTELLAEENDVEEPLDIEEEDSFIPMGNEQVTSS